MPQLLVSTGSSDQAELGYLNALAGIIGAMNNAGEARVVARRVEETPNGIFVTVEVLIFSEEEMMENTPDAEEEESGGTTGAVSHERRQHPNIADYAYLQSAHSIQQERDMMYEQTIEAIAHTENYIPNTPPVESEFEEAAHPSDASYIYVHHDNDNRENWGERITTELATQEIEDSVRHDVLSAGTVVWGESVPVDRAPAPPAQTPPEAIPPEENFQREAQNRKPAADDLDLVA